MKHELEDQEGPDLKPAIRLLSWFTVCYVFSFVGYLGSSQGIWFWFQSLRRPAWSLPVWLYTPAQTVLFGIVAWASWYIWITDADSRRKNAMILFFTQLTLGAIWPWIFFAWHKPVLSVVLIFAQFLVTAACVVAIWKLVPRSGKLMIPFLLWTGYLATLILVVWRLNR